MSVFPVALLFGINEVVYQLKNTMQYIQSIMCLILNILLLSLLPEFICILLGFLHFHPLQQNYNHQSFIYESTSCKQTVKFFHQAQYTVLHMFYSFPYMMLRCNYLQKFLVASQNRSTVNCQISFRFMLSLARCSYLRRQVRKHLVPHQLSVRNCQK